MRKRVWRVFIILILLCSLHVTALGVRMLVPVGRVVGLQLQEGSVIVVALDDTLGQTTDCGIQPGDDIQKIDNTVIDSVQQLQEALRRSDGRVTLTLERRGKLHQIAVHPVITAQGPRLGVLVREGISGIGTVTYYDPETDSFGALGHGVSDSDGQLAQMRQGSIYSAAVSSVRPGRRGKPGQLDGALRSDVPIGQLRRNCARGIFGSCEEFPGQALPVGTAQVGPAQILSNISGQEVGTYAVEILKIGQSENGTGRDLLIQVTDPDLLAATGGIVAGMSGSPILQDGKLVGAVTHVLVNDPTTGYGIFIENMLDAAG